MTEDEKPMRTGVFGGTFNPIHTGHLMAAREAVARFCLDRLFFVPCYLPPHKPATALASAEDRLTMIRLALPEDDHRYRISEMEIRRGGPSYTVDTVEAFSVAYPGDELFLIMGMDAFFELHTWKRRSRIQALAAVVVVSRGVDRTEDKEAIQDRVKTYLHSRLSADYGRDGTENCWRCADSALKPVYLFLADPVDVSSSQVRECLVAGRSAAPWLPPAVDDYINKNGLYR
ncbi:nicotinate-nucleotide adenylyltransferase [Desulfosarcina sp. OttesenSCG-928-G10]|nr:nicotinate-nucleotide adenylyltransferase [Desulfosarcina sp. OttesenSCG-928-G10]MDL2321167.1 nicotinate-nucleotide adenylyltransferase [Desulfosarcina sp. OttesenSCG-928-B08]